MSYVLPSQQFLDIAEVRLNEPSTLILQKAQMRPRKWLVQH